MNKKIGVSIIVLIVSGCLILSAAGIGVGVWIFKKTKDYTLPTKTAEVVVATPGSTPIPVEGTPVDGTPVEGLSSEILAQMDKIQREVSEIRGLQMKTDLKRDLLTPEQLKDKVINDFFKDYTAEDAVNDVKVLSTLGLVEKDFDIQQFYIDLYSEQIAGFYDSETKDMFVIAGDGFGGMERMTYAHEYTHVLQDQNYDLEKGMKLNDDYCKLDTEYCAAASALIEGDASLSEQYWFQQHASSDDYNELLEFQKNYSSPVYDSAPLYMQEDFLFPYVQGAAFVKQLYDQDGWSSVDEAFGNPPVTTEQILHPERYPEDKPVVVELPDMTSALGEGWSEYERNVMGEWYSYLIFARPITQSFAIEDDRAADSAEGWGGDTYLFYIKENSDDFLFAWRSTWETGRDADEYFDTAQRYGKSRWGIPSVQNSKEMQWTTSTGEVITMRKLDSDVLWLIGSSESLVETALVQIADFGN